MGIKVNPLYVGFKNINIKGKRKLDKFEYFNSAKFRSLSKEKQIELLKKELLTEGDTCTRIELCGFNITEEKYDKTIPEISNVKDRNISCESESSVKHELYEGDNLAVLKHLKDRGQKVDVIYIDPPYNTRNQFNYDDNRKRNEWLSFMYKRLNIARELLTDDGVIFVSIDDNEQAQLKLLMDSIFGEKNGITPFIWEKSYSPKNNNKFNSSSHEYIMVYSKNKELTGRFERLERTPKNNRHYKFDDGDGKGLYRKGDLTAPNSKHWYDIEYNGRVYPAPKGNGWRFSKEKMYKLIEKGSVYLPEDVNKRPALKRYLKDVGGVVTTTILKYQEVGHTDKAKRELDEVMGDKSEFDYPKPVDLVKYLLKLYPRKCITILDFFAGSGTTGHAVMELNKEDGGNRQFILCTTNEVNSKTTAQYLFDKGYINKPHIRLLNKFKKDYPEKYQSIVESKEYQDIGIARAVMHKRIKHVIEGYTTPKGEEVKGLNGNSVKYYKVK